MKHIHRSCVHVAYRNLEAASNRTPKIRAIETVPGAAAGIAISLAAHRAGDARSPDDLDLRGLGCQAAARVGQAGLRSDRRPNGSCLHDDRTLTATLPGSLPLELEPVRGLRFGVEDQPAITAEFETG